MEEKSNFEVVVLNPVSLNTVLEPFVEVDGGENGFQDVALFRTDSGPTICFSFVKLAAVLNDLVVGLLKVVTGETKGGANVVGVGEPKGVFPEAAANGDATVAGAGEPKGVFPEAAANG